MARQAQATAKEAQAQAQAERNLQTAERNLQDYKIEKFKSLLRDGDAFIQNGEIGFALGKYQEAQALMPGDTAVERRIRQHERR